MKSEQAPVVWSWSRAVGARAWRGARRRWLLGGVLVAVVAAVLAPRLGASGGNYRMLRAH